MNKTADTNLWGIHAGKTGDADSLFPKINCCRSGEGWSPYLSCEDAGKLDEVRGALRQSDLMMASKLARVCRLTPVTV